MRSIDVIIEDHVLREEVHKRAKRLCQEVEKALADARAHGLPAALIERLEEGMSYAPSMLKGLDKICRQVGPQAPRNDKSREELYAEAIKKRQPIMFEHIQWHLRTPMYDCCQVCLSNEINYVRQGLRQCLACKHVYKLGMSVKAWKKKVTGQVKSKKRDSPVSDYCQFPGCTGSYFARGWCSTHYQQWRRDPDDMWPIKPKECQAPSCHRTQYGHGYCLRHWRQIKKHGHIILSNRELGRVCKVPDCGERNEKKGYCARHYAQYKVYGYIP